MLKSFFTTVTEAVAVWVADALVPVTVNVAVPAVAVLAAVKVSVEPSVLGGARVQVGSDLYDGTISRRLAIARQVLTSG